MAKVTNPLFSGDASGNFGKKMIFKRGGIVTKMFSPRNPNTIAQANHREAFRSYYMAALTQAQADLLYAAIIHQHNDLYSLLGHGHNHGDLSGLGDDDHAQYFNQARGDARYRLLSEVLKYTQVFGTHGLGQTVAAGTTSYLSIFATGILTALSANPISNGGVLKNLRVRTGSVQPSTGSFEFTLNVGGLPSVLTLVIPAGGVNGSYSDLVHTVNFTAGQNVRIDAKNNATTPSATIGMVIFDLEQSVV